MKSLLLFIFLLLTVTVVFAQKQNNIWYFDNNAGLDFNSGTPVALYNGQLNSAESATMISDKATGQLLFYSDGVTIWNANHTIMANGTGLMGCNSSTQGVLVVPKSANDSTYYLFTADCIENNLSNGLRYSVVDLSMNTGLGEVIDKNTLLNNVSTEKLTAVTHANGMDFWLVIHEWNTNNFLSYLVSCDQISTAPVISNIGAIHGDNLNATGYLKVSPDGQKIAIANRGTPATTELFDFDNSTGIVSNLVKLPANGGEYGVAFSSNNSKLYFTVESFPGARLYQYDLGSGDSTAIVASKTLIAYDSLGFFGALQIAPDDKIYVTHFPLFGGSGDSLGIINNPDSLGIACGYTNNGFYVGTQKVNMCLPNFIGTSTATN